jgi:hypothetical protein
MSQNEQEEEFPTTPEGEVLPKRRKIGGAGGIRNPGMSESADKQRITLRPTEDEALAAIEKQKP